jgi:hypothetical protein
MIQVSDTGTGMDAETVQRIFEPFFTTKAQGKGTGLGLATVQAIIQQFGGCITVDSACGQGTTFRIYLPQTEEESSQAETPAAPAAARGSETVLLAEDEALVRQMVGAVLTACGYTVLEATQGDEALRLCREHEGPIDLLLTDVIMPGLCGAELAQHATECRPGLKTLFMSGYTEESLGTHGIAAVTAPFIRKPFAPADLARKVREVLS